MNIKRNTKTARKFFVLSIALISFISVSFLFLANYSDAHPRKNRIEWGQKSVEMDIEAGSSQTTTVLLKRNHRRWPARLRIRAKAIGEIAEYVTLKPELFRFSKKQKLQSFAIEASIPENTSEGKITGSIQIYFSWKWRGKVYERPIRRMPQLPITLTISAEEEWIESDNASLPITFSYPPEFTDVDELLSNGGSDGIIGLVSDPDALLRGEYSPGIHMEKSGYVSESLEDAVYGNDIDDGIHEFEIVMINGKEYARVVNTGWYGNMNYLYVTLIDESTILYITTDDQDTYESGLLLTIVETIKYTEGG